MKKNNIRDTPVIVIPKGYTIDDLMDFDDEGYHRSERRNENTRKHLKEGKSETSVSDFFL